MFTIVAPLSQVTATVSSWREVVPAEVRTHLRAARKERLLAARALLDHRIEHLENAPADTLPRQESISLD